MEIRVKNIFLMKKYFSWDVKSKLNKTDKICLEVLCIILTSASVLNPQKRD